MTHLENDLDIYYAVGNANTQRQESEIAAIINKRNSGGWKFILISAKLWILKTNSQTFIYFGKRNSA